MSKIVCHVCMSDDIKRVIYPLLGTSYFHAEYICQNCGRKFIPDLFWGKPDIFNSDLYHFVPKIKMEDVKRTIE